MKLVLSHIQMKPNKEFYYSLLEPKYKNCLLLVLPILHRLNRAGGIVKAGKLRACSNNINKSCKFILMFSRCNKSWKRSILIQSFLISISVAIGKVQTLQNQYFKVCKHVTIHSTHYIHKLWSQFERRVLKAKVLW